MKRNKKLKYPKADLIDLIKLAGFNKLQLSRELNYSYVSVHKWCKNPQRWLTPERAELFDDHLGVMPGTTMDVVMDKHDLDTLADVIGTNMVAR